MLNVMESFHLEGKPVKCERYGNGHINETYLLATDAPHRYILQKVNRCVFPDTDALMANVAAVTGYLRGLCPDPRRVLTLVSARDGNAFVRDGECWRVYEFVEHSVCLEKAEGPGDMRECGAGFGRFQRQLENFPVHTLREILPRFHDTPARFAQLHRAMEEDRAGRRRMAAPELDAFLAREGEADALLKMQRSGLLPTRVIHGDTKLNNVMLDEATRRALCVIDLDTVIPGLAAFDFGDAIRFGANTAAEDEPQTARAGLDMDLYRAFAAGFLEACGQSLTEAEIRSLPLGARMMTLECGVRFLTDYLNGDVYFRVCRPGHNLDRARCQLALLTDMERKREAMEQAVEACRRRAE